MHTFFLTLSASENVTLCSQPLLFPGTKSGIEEIPGLLIFEAKQLDFQLPDWLPTHTFNLATNPTPHTWVILLSTALPFFSRHSVLQSLPWLLSLPRFNVFSSCVDSSSMGAEPIGTLEISWSENNMNYKSVRIPQGQVPCLRHLYTPSYRHSAWLIEVAQIIFAWRQRRRYVIYNTARGSTDF